MDCKVCSKCKATKPISEFSKETRTKDGLRHKCKSCLNAYNRQITKNPKYIETKTAYMKKRIHDPNIKLHNRNVTLKRIYGITHDDYTRMLDNQNGVCILCGTAEPSNRTKHFAVDHNHETGKVRGLLCSSCNTKLGWLENNKQMIDIYLNKYN